MKAEFMIQFKAIGYKEIKCKLNCDSCGNYTKVLEYGDMTESGYESDHVYCEACLKLKHPNIAYKN